MFDTIKKFIKQVPFTKRISIVTNRDKFSSYPSNGLTPERLARIFREADTGDVLRQMELFEEMEEKDPHIFSQLQTRKNAVTGLDYEIIEASDNLIDKQVAEFVTEQFSNIESLEEILIDILDAIGKGISFIEIIWDLKKGKFVVKNLQAVHQKHFYWDDKDFLRLRTDEEPVGIYIPQNKFIIHKYKAKSGHPSRAGILRIVAWMYLFKNYDIKDWVSFCEVFGMPMRLGKYDPSASEDDKKALMDALINLGTDASGMYPTGTEIELKESNKQSSADIYEKLARFCDEQVSKCILGQTLTSDSGGSYAQSRTHDEVRHDLIVADCKALASTLRRDLITPLVKFNFGDVKIPTIRFDCEESKDLSESAKTYDILINKLGLKISASHIYKKFSIPKPEDGEEVLKGEKEQQISPMLPIANKSKIDNSLKFETNQKEIDKLIDVASDESTKLFKNYFEVIKDKVNNVTSLEELKEILEDKNKVYEILKQMHNPEFEKLLSNGMITSYLMGRSKEDG